MASPIHALWHLIRCTMEDIDHSTVILWLGIHSIKVHIVGMVRILPACFKMHTNLSPWLCCTCASWYYCLPSNLPEHPSQFMTVYEICCLTYPMNTLNWHRRVQCEPVAWTIWFLTWIIWSSSSCTLWLRSLWQKAWRLRSGVASLLYIECLTKRQWACAVLWCSDHCWGHCVFCISYLTDGNTIQKTQHTWMVMQL